jgi:hypothetical protein
MLLLATSKNNKWVSFWAHNEQTSRFFYETDIRRVEVGGEVAGCGVESWEEVLETRAGLEEDERVLVRRGCRFEDVEYRDSVGGLRQGT